MINIFLERDCLSGILLGKGSTTFFCKELHSKYFGFCKSRGKIKALQGYVGTCIRTIKNGKAWLAGRMKPGGDPRLFADPSSRGSVCLHNFHNSVIRRQGRGIGWNPQLHGLASEALWPVTYDLPRWPLPPPPTTLPEPLPSTTWTFCLVLGLLFSTCTCSFFCLEYSLPDSLWSGWLLLKFQVLVPRLPPQRGLPWPPGPPSPASHIPAGIPAWNGVFICLVVFPPLPSLFQGRNCLIYLPLYPYIKNKKVLNLVFNSYSNSLKFSFTRIH